MLGIRLKPEDEERLARHAQSIGKPTSTMARDWIIERLARESIDEQMRRAARILAAHDRSRGRNASANATDAFLHMLDEQDGGYDWGPEGPPA